MFGVREFDGRLHECAAAETLPFEPLVQHFESHMESPDWVRSPTRQLSNEPIVVSRVENLEAVPDEVVLRLEMAVEGGLGDADLSADSVDTCRVDAFAVKELCRYVNDQPVSVSEAVASAPVSFSHVNVAFRCPMLIDTVFEFVYYTDLSVYKEGILRVEAGSMIRQTVRTFGDRTALKWNGGSATFAEANSAANRTGAAFRSLGMSIGDRIGVLAYNTPEVVYAWLGLEKHGLVRVVLHSHFEMSAHVASLDHVEARALLFDTRFAEEVGAHRGSFRSVDHFVGIGPDCPTWAIAFDDFIAEASAEEPMLDVDENDPAFLQLTTGTTGVPKVWIETHRTWRAVINQNLIHLDDFGPGSQHVDSNDVNVHFHPIQWASGFQTLYPYWVRGATTVLVDDEVFDPPSLARTLLAEGATGALVPAPMWPPILDELEELPESERRFRRIVLFFATPEQLVRTNDVLGPVWCHGFGSTEQGAVTTRLLASDLAGHPDRIESVGRVGSPFIEVGIFDDQGNRLGPGEVGEIAVRSAMSIGGYWDLPDKTAEAFFPGDWFRPFDVGYIDEDGFLYYSDRAGDKIQTEIGVVYPHQVESALLRHEAVVNCGVVGLGPDLAQEVTAAVLLDAGQEGSDDLANAIIREASRSLDEPARPTRVVFVDELPTVLGGAKVQRSVLKEQLQASSR